jgi:hypothetical protein
MRSRQWRLDRWHSIVGLLLLFQRWVRAEGRICKYNDYDGCKGRQWGVGRALAERRKMESDGPEISPGEA